MFWILDCPLAIDNDMVYRTSVSCAARKVWESDLCKTCGRVPYAGNQAMDKIRSQKRQM